MVKKYINSNLFYPLLLILVCLVIAITNHIPATYLSGWDTLHPEFNFGLAFSRLINGVYRYEQGLGAVAAHAQMSDLPRVVILYLVSAIVPNDLLRYIFIISNLLVGVLGTYYFLKKIIFSHIDHHLSSTLSFLGGLYYLFNLGTLQQFNVPFEMFTVQYAMLPWIFLYSTKYIINPNTKNLVLFSFVTLLATPMAFASTLWYAFFLCFILYIPIIARKHLKRGIILIIITLAINSFWLLPDLYFLFSGNASFVPKANINKIFSEEAFTYNQSYGNFIDVAIFKNFLFDWPVYNGNNNFGYLLAIWNNYLSNPFILSIGYLAFAFCLLGIFASFKKKDRIALSFIIPAICCFIFLANVNPPFGPIFKFFQDHSQIFKEALRFPFTKFSILLMFFFSIFFALGNYYLFSLIPALVRKKLLVLTPIFWLVLLSIFMFPVYNGNLISKQMEVKIPNEYQQLFSWFDKQPENGRIAIFPVHSLWGWIYYNWGFQGAQFVSFGIKQPLLDRDYDRWNVQNEDYYRQMSYAVYAQNEQLFESVLRKYNVRYLLLDKSVIAPGYSDAQTILDFNGIESLCDNSSKIKLVKQFNFIKVYQFNDSPQTFLYSPKTNTPIAAFNNQLNIDWPLLEHGNYFFQKKSSLVYPYLHLSDNQGFIDPNILSINNSEIQLNTSFLPKNINLPLETFLQNEILVPSQLYIKSDKKLIYFKFSLFDKQMNPSEKDLLYTIPQPSDKPDQTILNIDSEQTLFLDTSSTTYKYEGNVTLNTKTFNNITLYFLNSKKFQPISQTVLNKPAYFCSDQDSNQLTNASASSNNLFLSAQNVQGCVHILLNQIIPSKQMLQWKDLLLLHYLSRSNDKQEGLFCYFDFVDGRCATPMITSPTNEDVLAPLLIKPIDLDRLELNFNIDTINLQKTVGVNFSDISYQILHPDRVISIDPNSITNAVSNVVINTHSSKLAINYGTGTDADILDQNHKSNSCSTILPQSFGRVVNKDKGYVEYSSVDGSSCDYFSFPNLLHNTGYIVDIKSKAIQGLPLRICIANIFTKRCDIYASLENNKINQLLLLPPSNDGGLGYDIHIDNYSVATVKSVNDLYDIRVIPFPFYWLSKMNFPKPGFHTLSAPVEISSFRQIIPGWYIFKYQNNNPDEGLVVANTNYDIGWYMPGHIHTTSNSWANAWIIKPYEKGTEFIIYIPQFLEFFGFGILILIFFYFILVSKVISRIFSARFLK